MDNVDVDIDTRCTISQYLKLIGDRASGNNRKLILLFDETTDRFAI